MDAVIPVVLFAYARPDHLKRTLECLRENNIPLLYVFSDGPKTPEGAGRVNEVRDILRGINWCETRLVERTENIGLGKSILAGVTEVLRQHATAVVFEDDLICIPGTYSYLCAALEHYKDDPQVMSVTGWTHPRVTPSTITNQPYFDGRTESWSWGTWSRVWEGMQQDAMSLVNSCIENKIDIYRYGADLMDMAKTEEERNIWAVRFSYLHILHGGLCLRPPRSMVNHAGFDEQGTNAIGPSVWSLEDFENPPLIPQEWPPAIENPECPGLWQKACGTRPARLSETKQSISKIGAGIKADVKKIRNRLMHIRGRSKV